MNPQALALLTAAAWGIGGYFEKKGLHLGGLSPQVGVSVRTAVALVVLGLIAAPQLKTLAHAGTPALLHLILGGGIVAGSVGMLCFYAAIKGAPLTQVMPIAFTAPMFGALAAVIFGGEPLTFRLVVGTALTVAGIVVLTTR
jgi:bacterial/archaeal transporter family protein